MPAHLQDAPRTLRSTFKVADPNDPKKTVAVVYASFAVCMEREANSLRTSLQSATRFSSDALYVAVLAYETHLTPARKYADDIDKRREHYCEAMRLAIAAADSSKDAL